jgi:hypothetical protein
MGTPITLSLNGIDIDWGKNDSWKSHYWLFPPGSLTDVEYPYGSDDITVQPAFQTTLAEAYFRLCHLGYSQQETKTKFEIAVARWNRTAELDLSYEDFRGALTSVDFSSLTSADLEPYIWDFRAFVAARLAPWNTDDAFLEDFIARLDFALTLRVLAERVDSRALTLRWNHQELINSGYVLLEDLTDIDLRTYIVNHTVLYGRLHDRSGASGVTAFDNWLVNRGLAQMTPYSQVGPRGTRTPKMTTLPTAVRNMIHHPENRDNALSDDRLRESIELLLGIFKSLPNPLSGLE